MKTIRLLVCEPVRVVREMLQALFNEQPDIHVVTTVREGRAALLGATEFDPDVILVDMLYQEQELIEIIPRLRDTAPRAKIIVMDFRPAEAEVSTFVRAGADGFILPDTPIENMLHVVRLAAAGMSASETAGVPVGVVAEAREPLAAFAGAFVIEKRGTAPVLSRREEQVASCICQGMSNKQIAGELNLSLHTVKSHVRRILEKLELHSRIELAAFGYRSTMAQLRAGPTTQA